MKDLKKLSKAEARRILNTIDKELSKNPQSNPALKGRFEVLRRLMIGDYRVLYVILEKDVLVLRIGYRRDVYRG